MKKGTTLAHFYESGKTPSSRDMLINIAKEYDTKLEDPITDTDISVHFNVKLGIYWQNWSGYIQWPLWLRTHANYQTVELTKNLMASNYASLTTPVLHCSFNSNSMLDQQDLWDDESITEALSVLMLCTPVFIFTSSRSVLLGCPCGLLIWLSLLAIFNTLFSVYVNFFHKNTDKTHTKLPFSYHMIIRQLQSYWERLFNSWLNIATK